MTECRAIHKDDGKPHLSLIDPLFLREVGKALTIPTVSGKYAPHNWRNGIEVSRLLNSTLRHINDFNDGVDNDVETGVSHLAHAACNLMFALRMMKDRPDLDDRYRAAAPIPQDHTRPPDGVIPPGYAWNIPQQKLVRVY